MEREIAIISGRMNHEVDPHLEIWGWEMPAYFFFGGLAAGILILAGILWLSGKQDRYPMAARFAPLIAPVSLGVGLGLLMLDLSHFWYFWRLFLTFEPASPISWGTWLLTFVMPLSVVFAFVALPRSVFLNWVRVPILLPIHDRLRPLRKPLALFLAVTGAGVGVYTGVLLSTLHARPFWNSNVLGALFLASGLTAGTAVSLLVAWKDAERKLLCSVLAGTIGMELLLLFLFVLGHATGGEMGQQMAHMLLDGEMAVHFLVFDVAVGLVAPLALVLFQLTGRARFTRLAPLLALFGGVMLRFTMVHGGQITKWLPY